MTGEVLTRADISGDQDVFAVRRLGRRIAELVGMESQDQIRMATALSEIGREVLASGAEGHVTFSLAEDRLVVTVEYGDGQSLRPSEGLTLAGRLVDEVSLAAEEGRVTLVKRVPGHRRSLTVADVRAGLAPLAPATALDELREQNKELARTLEQVLRLNAELAETNQGVMALYNQLSAELEETNRGVVALYAELDEKSSQLRSAAEARQRFWANVSHELRMPLTSIIGLVRLMVGAGGEPLTEEQEHQVNLIGGSAETLLVLVGELLDLAKAESGRLDPEPSVVDVVAVAEALRGTLHTAVRSEGVGLVIDVSPEVGEMLVDEVMLTRILRNLLSNALKFTQEGEVRLSAEVDPEMAEVVFTISDTGVGIPEELLERVFEEFFQVPGPLQLKAKGTGLGLPYARRLAEALGGDLELSSTQGEGTTVTLRVPHRMASPEIGHVLVADDDAGFRALARRLLFGFAAVVDEAADGYEALERMREHVPDVALVDLFMPRLDGAALRQRMAEDESLREVPVVTVSGALDEQESAHLSLSKHGLRRDRLLETIREAVAARRGGGADD
ncbi:response regulator [Microbispora triticiradicis]|uniref:histidine kinase n=3 Tax=Microbispora TaxID=2005 RepID=A0ABY3M1G0_9ACTN|nr:MULTISPECIES: ATP-binding protein [Microbispora]RGA06444.1 response regulator [Microbispora triticiradicis]TLP62447.1 response regulator [Microbispora fusca]TYB62478.1 response regulator [Microbispora tritici]GLW22231.1 sensor histidine kinase [Microbispora amethystogenes]